LPTISILAEGNKNNFGSLNNTRKRQLKADLHRRTAERGEVSETKALLKEVQRIENNGLLRKKNFRTKNRHIRKFLRVRRNRMKRLATILLTLAAITGTPAFAGSGIEFSPDAGSAGRSILTVRSADDSTIYLKATLGKGDLVPVGTIGAAYTSFTTDLTDVYVTEAGKALGSAVLSAIVNSNITTIDFELPLQGGSGTKYYSFAQMLAGGYVCGNGFSGAQYSRAGDYCHVDLRLIGFVAKTQMI